MTHLEYHLGFDAPETFCLDTRNNIWLRQSYFSIQLLSSTDTSTTVDASEHIEADHGAFGTLPMLPDLVTVCDTAGDNDALPLDKRVRYDTVGLVSL